jgi:cysteine desulfurase
MVQPVLYRKDNGMDRSKIYLDNNATTIVDPHVRDGMLPFYSEMYGNPNSLHVFGTEVHPYMKIAFDNLYEGIGAHDDDDIIINSCATEGNNTVIKGVYYSLILQGPKKQIITTEVEHPCVMNSCRFLQELGVEVTYLPVNGDGIVDVDTLRQHLDPDRTALVSIMWANNETGLINPVRELATYCRENNVLFHTDAVQAIGKVKVDVQDVPVDFLTLSAHKFHGPKGIGGLFIRRGVDIPPLLHGGEQMGGKRGGTVDTAGLVGMGLAMELAVKNLEFEQTEVRRLRDKLEDAIAGIPGTNIIGRRELRTPNTTLVSVKGVEGEALIWDLNRGGVAASTGSACASESLEPNPTFVAMHMDNDLAHTGIRLSLSRFTTEEEIDEATAVLVKSIERLRKISIQRR